MSDSYEVGTRAWQPDATEGWVPSEVEQKIVEGEKVRLLFRLDSGEVSVIVNVSRFPSYRGITTWPCVGSFLLSAIFLSPFPHPAIPPDICGESTPHDVHSELRLTPLAILDKSRRNDSRRP